MFDKVSDNGRRVTLEWASDDGKERVEHTMKVEHDRPLPAFLEAFGAIAAPTLKILRLPKTFECEVRSVTVTRSAEDGGLATAQVHLVAEIPNSNRPLNINTPLLELDTFNNLIRYVETILHEAEQFAFHKARTQGQLDLKEEQPENQAANADDEQSAQEEDAEEPQHELAGV